MSAHAHEYKQNDQIHTGSILNVGPVYFASYQIRGDHQLSITDIASTEMWCLQPKGIMEQETKFLQWLDEANSYRINDDQLTLYGNDRQQKLVFHKKHN